MKCKNCGHRLRGKYTYISHSKKMHMGKVWVCTVILHKKTESMKRDGWNTQDICGCAKAEKKED